MVIFIEFTTEKYSKKVLLTKRFECVEVSSERNYLFNPNADLELLPS